MSLLLADAGIGLTDVTPVVSAIGSLGFAIWFAYYTTTTTLPNQQKEHRDQIRELAETHSNTIKEIVGELRASREAYDRWRTNQSATH